MINDRLMSVMAPLRLQDGEFEDFSSCLGEARERGVEAISVDVWWGLVMEGRDNARWEYYDRIFEAIGKAGLQIVPIMSFHACGGGPGDDVNIPLTYWLSDIVTAHNGDPRDLLYQSETGRQCSDAVPPWVAEEVPALYEAMSDFVGLFLERYRKHCAPFPEINLSLGPTGELRYPSYSAADGWKFPHRGYYQCYSESARRSFLRWVRDSRNDCTWAGAYKDFEIRVPSGHLPPGSGARADGFVADGLHLKPGYGRDFLAWYHQSLIDHGRQVLTRVIKTVKGHFADVPHGAPIPFIGMKIPGVHWQWRCTGVPRYAELTAGLIPAGNCFVPGRDDTTGYEDIFAMVKDMAAGTGWPMRVHFTALEMDDDSVECSWPRDEEKTSMAYSLVNAVGRTAEKFSIILCGENALPYVAADDPATDIKTWEYIRKAFDTGYFSGFTLLRLCRNTWNVDKESLRKFIQDYDYDASGPVMRFMKKPGKKKKPESRTSGRCGK